MNLDKLIVFSLFHKCLKMMVTLTESLLADFEAYDAFFGENFCLFLKKGNAVSDGKQERKKTQVKIANTFPALCNSKSVFLNDDLGAISNTI